MKEGRPAAKPQRLVRMRLSVVPTLAVRGRTSGEWRTVPVNVLELEGQPDPMGGHTSMLHRRSLLFLPVLLAVLTGCAVSQPPLRPVDLPELAVESPIVLHWRIDRGPDRVTAVGLVEIPHNPERVEMVMVELQGIDGQGRAVSWTRELVLPRSFTGAEPWPFRVSLGPTGTEERFAVGVAEVTWRRQMMGQ